MLFRSRFHSYMWWLINFWRVVLFFMSFRSYIFFVVFLDTKTSIINFNNGDLLTPKMVVFYCSYVDSLEVPGLSFKGQGFSFSLGVFKFLDVCFLLIIFFIDGCVKFRIYRFAETWYTIFNVALEQECGRWYIGNAVQNCLILQ